MPSGVETLRELCQGLEQTSAAGGLPPDVLRFVLEYPTAPDLDAETRRLAELVESDAFELELMFDDEPDLDGPDPNDPEDPDGVFVVLQFPGLERTVKPRTLFSMAYDLTAELGLLSAEPDLGSDLYRDPEPPRDLAETESVAKNALDALCWVDDGDPPHDEEWALKTIRAPQAWAISSKQGEGIIIGQPDTGIAEHIEIDAANLRLDLSRNILNGTDDPTDPVNPGRFTNPGHGTATASVAISGPAADMQGSAPKADLVPIRCVDRVVVFNAAPVAKAIDHARKKKCHVITMSLGGTPSWSVHKAVKRATKAGIIVLAAAGNCSPQVVFPARLKRVIAVGGCNQSLGTWKGSSRGGAVDICAPAELVWKAERSPEHADIDRISAGQGTSFAVALTAGVAALWLSHWGVENVIAAARSEGVTVQELFRSLLKRTAHKPPGWDSDDYGAGIVNAEKLLQEPITGASPTVEPESNSGQDVVNQHFATTGDDSDFDWRRFRLEVSATVLNDERLGAGPGVETAGTPISDQLREALGRSGNKGLTALEQRPTTPVLTPPTIWRDHDDPLLLTAGRPQSGLESSAPITHEQALQSLDESGIRNKVDRLGEHLGAVRGLNPDAELERVHQEAIDDARQVLDTLKQGKMIERDDVRSQVALEALVRLHGRPAIRLEEGPIDPNSKALGDWQTPIVLAQRDLLEARKSVGRIDGDGRHAGTGFVVGDGLVLTNRHVLEAVAAAAPRATNPERWIFESTATINFSNDASDPDKQFDIVGVEFAGRDPILGRDIDFAKMDLALLRVDTGNGGASEWPDPLTISTDGTKTAANRTLMVLGYPAMPSSLPLDDEGNVRIDVVTRLNEIFGLHYGVKYLSPGVVVEDTKTVPGSPHDWVFAHDATSLGGNSGSCVLTLDGGLAVAGLHFAGDWLRANYAHDFAALRGARDMLSADASQALFGTG